MPAFAALPPAERDVVFVACLMHDVAKPATTRIEDDGRVTAKGHSRAGELLARRLLWELGAPFALREAVCGLIRYHQIPFFLVDRADAARVAAEVSVVARCDLLAMVAEADIRGRVCADLPRVLDQIELYRALVAEEGCASTPRRFASDHTRFVYFRSDATAGRHPDIEAFDDTRGELVLTSGSPEPARTRGSARTSPTRRSSRSTRSGSSSTSTPDEAQGGVVQVASASARAAAPPQRRVVRVERDQPLSAAPRAARRSRGRLRCTRPDRLHVEARRAEALRRQRRPRGPRAGGRHPPHDRALGGADAPRSPRGHARGPLKQHQLELGLDDLR